MEPVGKIGPATIVGSGRASRQGLVNKPDVTSPQRALVRVTPVAPLSEVAVRPTEARPAAAFLAHLIATVQGAPQTREHRRADPNWATTTYAAKMLVPEVAGQGVSESR